MRVNIRGIGVEITSQMRERIDWICTRLEKIAGIRDVSSLQCGITVTKIPADGGGHRFQAAIYFSDPGESLRGLATAASAIEALDIAHDEIERAFFRDWRATRDRQRVRDFAAREALRLKKAEEEKKTALANKPPRRVIKWHRFGDEE